MTMIDIYVSTNAADNAPKVLWKVLSAVSPAMMCRRLKRARWPLRWIYTSYPRTILTIALLWEHLRTRELRTYQQSKCLQCTLPETENARLGTRTTAAMFTKVNTCSYAFEVASIRFSNVITYVQPATCRCLILMVFLHLKYYFSFVSYSVLFIAEVCQRSSWILCDLCTRVPADPRLIQTGLFSR